MATITAIVENPRKAGRYLVELDGRGFATVSLDMLERMALRIGATVDDGLRARVAAESAALATYDRAVNLLAFQARSSRDLRRRLIQKGEDAALVDAALERLAAAGLVDDSAFAKQFTRSRVLGQGASRRRLQQELFKRGVNREVADSAIAEVMSDELVDEAEMVVRAARKKVRSLAKLDAESRCRRLYAFLARRGYDSETIRKAMHTVLADADRADLDDALAGAADDE